MGSDLFSEIRELILSARQNIARGVDLLQVMTNFEIGRRIVEHEQAGSERAEYGKQAIIELSEKLFAEFGAGFSPRNLRNMRKFYLVYQDRASNIWQKSSAKSIGRASNIWQKSSAKSVDTCPGRTESLNIQEVTVSQSFPPFRLSWSHYVFLIGIKDVATRNFYEIESANNNWTLKELTRQFNSGLYERLALSRNKDEIRKLSEEGQIISRPQDVLKEPYVLEFLGLDERTRYSESDLETAIIDKLEQFLLELGKGFLFEARQKRFTFDEDHFYVDLVFYNRLLKCYVLIDLKIGKLTHQDLGQMQMYVNYFDRPECAAYHILCFFRS